MNLLFVAHDPGGANMLLPAIELAAEAGHHVHAVAAGPAQRIWSGVNDMIPRAPGKRFPAHLLKRVAADIVVTGTSYSAEIERDAWCAAKRWRVPSVAAIDSWFGFSERLRRREETAAMQPCAVLVPDEACSDAMRQIPWLTAGIRVVGQPHLQRVARILGQHRSVAAAPSGRIRLLFVSENMAEHDGGHACPLMDQFAVAERLLDVLPEAMAIELLILPHPRERVGPWRQWVLSRSFPPGTRAALSLDGSEPALVCCDAVVGMNSMVLLEAVIAGVPVMAVKLDPRWPRNPMIDRAVSPHLSEANDDLRHDLESFLSHLGGDGAARNEVAAVVERADERLLDAVVQIAQTSGGNERFRASSSCEA